MNLRGTSAPRPTDRSSGSTSRPSGQTLGGLLRFGATPVELPPATVVQAEHCGRPAGDDLVDTVANDVERTDDLRPGHLSPPPPGHGLRCPSQAPRMRRRWRR